MFDNPLLNTAMITVLVVIAALAFWFCFGWCFEILVKGLPRTTEAGERILALLKNKNKFWVVDNSSRNTHNWVTYSDTCNNIRITYFTDSLPPWLFAVYVNNRCIMYSLTRRDRYEIGRATYSLIKEHAARKVQLAKRMSDYDIALEQLRRSV